MYRFQLGGEFRRPILWRVQWIFTATVRCLAWSIVVERLIVVIVPSQDHILS